MERGIDLAADTMNRPKFSCVITTWNRPDDCLEALRSCLQQSVPFTDIIIVDDSSDKSYAAIEELVKRNRHVSYFRNDFRRGANFGRNHGYQLATGDFVCFLDDDDIFLDDKVSVLSSALSSTGNGKLIAYHDYYLLYRAQGQRFVRTKAGTCRPRDLLVENLIGPTSMVALSNVPGFTPFDEGVHALQDWDAWINAINFYGFSAFHVSAVLAEYRIESTASTSKSVSKFRRAYSSLMNKYDVSIVAHAVENMNDLKRQRRTAFYSTLAWKYAHSGAGARACLTYLRCLLISPDKPRLALKALVSLFGVERSVALVGFFRRGLRRRPSDR